MHPFRNVVSLHTELQLLLLVRLFVFAQPIYSLQLRVEDLLFQNVQSFFQKLVLGNSTQNTLLAKSSVS